jgi:catechol 2,3-dioxygenase-like lactoylglutathione lyase family enzyme
MKPRVTLITLGVDDLAKSLAFYRDGLGWPGQGIVGEQFEYGAVAFFDLQPGLKLALWPRASLARDTGLAETPRSPVNTAHDVDAAMARAKAAGAKIVKPAGKTFWGGYAGYFADPDGHLWEVAWNPQMVVAD